jgi:hypothetical protein
LIESQGAATSGPPSHSELRELFHRLNNQLGVILAHAELIETKQLEDGATRSASQVVSGALAAIDTVRTLKNSIERLQP